MNRKKLILPSLLPSLGFLYGHVFMWSNNAHMFSSEALMGALGIVLVVASLMFCCFFYLLPWLLRCLPSDKLRRNIFYILVAATFVFMGFVIIDYSISDKNMFFIPIFLCIYFFLFMSKEKIPVTCLSIMLCFSGIIFVKNNFFENDEQIETFPSEVYNIKFKKRPNIYLFWLESYHDFDILKRVYGIDSSEYKNYLEKNNFIIQENTYSSGQNTLTAMTQLYSLNNLSIKQLGNQDVSRNARDIIGGNANNAVFKILKNNGYNTMLITIAEGPSAKAFYYLTEQHEYLDEVDFEVNVYKIIAPIVSINSYYEKMKFIKKIYRKSLKGYQGNLENRVKNAMKRGKIFGKPYIIAFKGGARHTSVTGLYSWKNRTDWIESEKYQKIVKKSNLRSQNIINYIIDNDPNSIILLLGDHGSTTYRGFPWEDMKNFDKYNITPTDILDDFFRVLFAYRLPHGAQDDISNGMYMSNINVFLHVFAYLADDPGILKYRTQSETHLHNAQFKMVEGKLVLP